MSFLDDTSADAKTSTKHSGLNSAEGKGGAFGVVKAWVRSSYRGYGTRLL